VPALNCLRVDGTRTPSVFVLASSKKGGKGLEGIAGKCARVQGKGGYGIGASKEVNDAIFKATRFAILGAINIPLYRGHTVYYPSKTKYIRTKMSIFPRPADFGLSASPIIIEACELLGIQNLTVKVRRYDMWHRLTPAGSHHI
jgi:hypothetical protein